jgi:hypothetical protein
MKTLMLSALAGAAALAMALPAAAQPYGGYQDNQRGGDRGYERGYDRDGGQYQRGGRGRGGGDYHLTSGYVDGLFWKLDNAAQEGRINRRQAGQLKAELRQVQEFAHPVQTGQASPWQRRRLEQVVARIDQALMSGGYRGDRGRDDYRDDNYRGDGYRR